MNPAAINGVIRVWRHFWSAGRAAVAAALVAVAAIIATLPVSAQVAGSFDTTFGATNGFISALAIGTSDDRANAVALQADGKIVLAGKCAGALGTYFCLARLNADGALDTSFVGPAGNGNGKFLLTVASSLVASADAVTVQTDGKILVAGNCSGKFCIARLNENGSFDASFVGPAGTATGHFALTIGTSTDTFAAMALQADGKIVLVGSCDNGTGYTQYCIARLNVDGSFDSTFDGPPAVSPANGRFLLPRFGTIPDRSEYADMLGIRANGKILVVGRCMGTFCFAQFNTNGTFDSSFDGPTGTGNGSVVLEASPSLFLFVPYAIAFQADDYAVIAADCSTTRVCVARITPGGVLDVSFAARSDSPAWNIGIGMTGIDDAVSRGIAVQFDGKLIVAGAGFTVARLNSDGAPDTAFDGPAPSQGNGVVELSITPNSAFLRAITLQPDGKIVMAGYCDSLPGAGDRWNFCIARLNPGTSGARNCTPDIDGDGRTTATIDGLIMTRVMLGLTGTAVTGGITFPTAAPRKTWSAIRSYLVTQCGMTLAP